MDWLKKSDSNKKYFVYCLMVYLEDVTEELYLPLDINKIIVDENKDECLRKAFEELKPEIDSAVKKLIDDVEKEHGEINWDWLEEKGRDIEFEILIYAALLDEELIEKIKGGVSMSAQEYSDYIEDNAEDEAVVRYLYYYMQDKFVFDKKW